MTNQELNDKIKEIVKKPTIEQIVEIVNFDKKYKQTDFYKTTKMSLEKLIRAEQINTFISMKWVRPMVQDVLDNLKLDHLEELMDQTASIFAQENADLAAGMNNLESFKDIIENEKKNKA